MKFKVGDKVEVIWGLHKGMSGTLIPHRFEPYPWFELEGTGFGVEVKNLKLLSTKEPLKDSQWAYRAIHQHIAEMLQVYLDSGEADVDFYESELKLAALMETIENKLKS